MIIELHLIQNFAPANLNRDDTGAPKDCEFGGYRRARVSSQCLKRAMRTHFRDGSLLSASDLGSRTKRLVDELVKRLVDGKGKPKEEAQTIAAAAVRGTGFGLDDEGKTQYLLFMAENEINALVDVCVAHWDELIKVTSGAANEAGAAKKSAKDTKKAGKNAVSADITKALLAVLDGGHAADLALFGRMIADLPEKNVDAACQVAHALSTNKVSVEFDFYTAVDDLKPEDTAGADMLGTVEFNSACFYRYANLDANQLLSNLGGDTELARKTVAAFVRAAVEAIPTGKQNSMAAQNPPSLVVAVLRERGFWSLANAFVEPVTPAGDGLVRKSIARLDLHWGQLARMYGDRGITGRWACSLEDDGLVNLASSRVDSIDVLVDTLVAAVRFGAPAGEGAR